VLALAILFGALAFHAYAGRQVAPARGPAAASSTGPVQRGEDRRGMPARTLALTFFGGPDPKWTPRLLDVLAESHAHATFFVLGAQVTEHPELVRRMLAEGHEVGLAGFRGDDAVALSGWRRQLDLSSAQGSLAAAAGVHARLFGVPASATDDEVRRIADDGFVVVRPDVDSTDVRTYDVGSILAESLPAGDAGAVVRMHDHGSSTVGAAKAMVRTLPSRGYRFTTVSEGLGAPAAEVPADSTQRFTGTVQAWTQRYGEVLIGALNLLIGAAGMLGLLRTVLQLGLAHNARRLRREREQHPVPWFAPPVTVVIPAYNESRNIVAAVRALAANTHSADVEVVVVDDGSTDGTADLVEALALPGVLVVRQENAGKPAALNRGVAHARHDILVLVDGDTIFEPETIGNLVQPLADPRIGAVSGNTKVGNRGGLLGRWQHLEYCAGSNLDRQILDALQCIPTVPGAIGAFRREALAAVGGVSPDTLAEDTDLTIAVSRAGWRVTYEQSARAWTEAPTTVHGLYRQRYRWSYGTFQAMWKHRGALTERGLAGRMGRYGLIYLSVFHFLLPLLAPAMDVYVLYGAFIADAPRAIVLWCLFLLVQMASAGYALRLDGESLRPLWTMPLQQLVYRQLMYLVVIQSLVTALHGTRMRWQSVRRTGQAGEALRRAPDSVDSPDVSLSQHGRRTVG
jgi:cellulose synthase/poly-beta-1,6-N-acetylglucosamine synthase-like glycosyltransferase/peptidoglycan/xylan/chitin deacetylase (PgdA/CDA1 family)